jgi:hypothetical protein
MPSPEGKGIARRAWDAYANGVNRATRPYVEPFVRKAAVPVMMDLAGFWLLWLSLPPTLRFVRSARVSKAGWKIQFRDHAPAEIIELAAEFPSDLFRARGLLPGEIRSS